MTVGWGIAGCGWVARDFVAPALRDTEAARAVALLDPSEGALREVGELLPGAARHREMEGFLSEPGLDAVYVATPNHLHPEVVRAAAGAGKPVLCEKPLATTLAGAREMVRVCREAGVPLGTAFDQRFHAAHRRIRSLVAEGALGTVCSVRVHYACWLPPEWAADNWRADPARAGGGALIDLAPHGMDLAQYLLGERLESVTGYLQRRVFDYPVEDGAVVAGQTASGVLFLQHVAYNTPEAYPRRTLEILGTEAMAVAENTMGQVPGGSLKLIRAGDGEAERVGIPPEEDRPPFLAQLEAFSRAVAAGEEFPFPPERDLHTAWLVEEAAGAADRTPEREVGA